MTAPTDDPNRRPRTAYVLGDIVIARRQQTAAADLDLGDQLAMIDALSARLVDLDPVALRVELVRIAALAVAAVEVLDERSQVPA